MSKNDEEIKQVVRAVKYKQDERDFYDDVDIKSLLNKLKPKHGEKLEVIIRRVK